MTADRNWVYNKMKNDTLVSFYVNGRVFQSTSLLATPHEKPFIMYRQTSDIPLVRGDDSDTCRVVGYMIFVHDIAGSYRRIDHTINVLRPLFADTNDPASGVIRSVWGEVSDDNRDEDMGTIMKFIRISVTYKA